VLVVGFEGDYSLDCAGHRVGLRYNRKAAVKGSNTDRFRLSSRAALSACRLLEKTPPVKNLRFNPGELELFVNDRALAPNTPATCSACEPELRSFFRDLFGPAAFAMEFVKDPRERFGVRVSVEGKVVLDEVLKKL
jgi:hypothetical protein